MKEMNLNEIAVRDPQIVSQQVEGEMILVVPTRGKVKVINEVGGRIWELCDGKRSIRQIAVELTREFDVELSQAEKDSVEFLNTLAERGLVHFIRPPDKQI